MARGENWDCIKSGSPALEFNVPLFSRPVVFSGIIPANMEKTITAQPRISRLTKGYLIALIGTIIWSATAVFIRYLTEEYAMPPIVLAFWRDAVTAAAMALFFILFTPVRLSIERHHLPFLVLYGFTLSIFNSLWTVSVSLNGAAVSTVLAYSSAGFTAIIAFFLYHERLDWVKILAVILSIGGCVLVAGAYNLDLWRINALGILTGLLSGVAFCAYSLLGKAATRRGMNSWTTLLYTFFFAALFLLSYVNVPGLFSKTAPPSMFWLGSAWFGWLLIFLLAIGPTIGGYGLYTYSMNFLPASVANLIATLEPSFTALQSYFLLGERFTPPQIIGSIMIIGGVIFLRIMEERK